MVPVILASIFYSQSREVNFSRTGRTLIWNWPRGYTSWIFYYCATGMCVLKTYISSSCFATMHTRQHSWYIFFCLFCLITSPFTANIISESLKATTTPRNIQFFKAKHFFLKNSIIILQIKSYCRTCKYIDLFHSPPN